jgi:hypothetical protein
MVVDTWNDRDLPVLRAVVELDERNGRPVTPEDVRFATGFDSHTVESALRALAGESCPMTSPTSVPAPACPTPRTALTSRGSAGPCAAKPTDLSTGVTFDGSQKRRTLPPQSLSYWRSGSGFRPAMTSG